MLCYVDTADELSYVASDLVDRVHGKRVPILHIVVIARVLISVDHAHKRIRVIRIVIHLSNAAG